MKSRQKRESLVSTPTVGLCLWPFVPTKEEIVGTLGFFGLIGNLIKIIGFMLIGFNFFEYLILILLMIPSTILGSKTGQVLLFKMNEKTFKIIFDIVLFSLAIRLLF